MTALEDRKTVICLIGEATSAGARQAPACSILGASVPCNLTTFVLTFSIAPFSQI
jgi:hypothetical protein